MNTIKKEKLGYNILEKELLKRDWDIYTPILEDTKVDCIISKNNYLIKIQIKNIGKDCGRKVLPVRKISHNQGEYKVHHYTTNEIDFFIGVDIETENIYLVPVEFSSKYKSSIGVNTLIKNNFINNFNDLEHYIGNDIIVEDDIGEGLTANTEGMSNQPVETR